MLRRRGRPSRRRTLAPKPRAPATAVLPFVASARPVFFSLSRQAGVTVLTAVGLTKFNLTDVGLTEGVKSVFVAQPPPAKLLASSPKLH